MGKVDQARGILAKLHSSAGDLHSPLIDLEMAEIDEKITIGGSDSAFLRFCFTNHASLVFRTVVGFQPSFSHSSGSLPSMDGHSYGRIRPAVREWSHHLFPPRVAQECWHHISEQATHT